MAISGVHFPINKSFQLRPVEIDYLIHALHPIQQFVAE